jgi:predicted nucleic-acid-binding Zn-ribbon protein
MSHFVPETAIDHDAVIRRGGRNLGDEDFALFKCPRCRAVYLLEYEVDTVYLDGADLSKRFDATDPSKDFICLRCNIAVPAGAWVGPKADDAFRVTWPELKASSWAWVATPLRSFGDET